MIVGPYRFQFSVKDDERNVDVGDVGEEGEVGVDVDAAPLLLPHAQLGQVHRLARLDHLN